MKITVFFVPKILHFRINLLALHILNTSFMKLIYQKFISSLWRGQQKCPEARLSLRTPNGCFLFIPKNKHYENKSDKRLQIVV